MAVYYSSLCKFYANATSQNTIECKSLLNGELRAGYMIYSKYLIGVDDSIAQNLRIAN